MSGALAVSVDAAWERGHAPLPGNARAREPWHRGPVTALALSADGRLALSAGVDGLVRAWDIVAGELAWQFERAARHVVLSPDGRVGYCLNEACEVWPLDLATGTELDRAWAPRWRVRRRLRAERAALSADGRWLLPPCDDGGDGAVLVDLARGAAVTLAAPGAGELYPLGAFAPDARSAWLLGGVRDGRTGRARSALYRFSVPDGAPEEIRALRLVRQNARVFAQLHRERCVVGDRWVLAVDAAGRLLLRWAVGGDEPVTWIAAGVDVASHLATGARVALVTFAGDRHVAAVDHAACALAGTAAVGDAVTALALSADESLALAGTAGGRVVPVRLGG